MEKQKEKTIGEKIQEWKDKYGDVYRVDVDGHTAYLKRPSRKALGAAAVLGKQDPMKYCSVTAGLKVTRLSRRTMPCSWAYRHSWRKSSR